MTLLLEPDVEVVGEAANGATAIEAVRELRPDVVIMDARMPVMDGITACRVICDSENGPAVIVLSMFDDADTVARTLSAGARAFLAKQRMDDELVTAIRRCVSSEGTDVPC